MGKSIRVIRLKGLKKECGITSISTANAKLIDSKHYCPIFVCHESDSEIPEFHTKVYYTKNDSDQIYYFIFSGFSAGYYGEGSRGLTNFLFHIAGMNYQEDIIMKTVAKLKSNRRYIFVLDEDCTDMIHINIYISPRNIKHLVEGTSIELKDKRPIIIKNWDSTTLQLL